MPILNQGKHLPFQIISKLCGYFSPVPSQPLCPCHQQYSETENVTVFSPIISIHILSWRTAKKVLCSNDSKQNLSTGNGKTPLPNLQEGFGLLLASIQFACCLFGHVVLRITHKKWKYVVFRVMSQVKQLWKYRQNPRQGSPTWYSWLTLIGADYAAHIAWN